MTLSPTTCPRKRPREFDVKSYVMSRKLYACATEIQKKIKNNIEMEAAVVIGFSLALAVFVV